MVSRMDHASSEHTSDYHRHQYPRRATERADDGSDGRLKRVLPENPVQDIVVKNGTIDRHQNCRGRSKTTRPADNEFLESLNLAPSIQHAGTTPQAGRCRQASNGSPTGNLNVELLRPPTSGICPLLQPYLSKKQVDNSNRSIIPMNNNTESI